MGNALASRTPRCMSPSSPPLRRPQKRKRCSRVTSDCGTAVSTTDSRGSSEKAGGATMSLPLDPTTEEEEASVCTVQSRQVSTDHVRRIQEAEKILVEIAKEYAAKRAAGLVPTKPVPARTLLWQEMERRAQDARTRTGRRGTCLYGRDSDQGACGCNSYRTIKKVDGQDNTGGLCECCKHGASWHRLSGGTMATSGNCSYTRTSRPSRTSSVRRDSSMYSESEYEDETDDEAIANEMARPYNASNGETLRLGSTSRQLDKLLKAIARYRAIGLTETEIELKLRTDFPLSEQLVRTSR